MNMKFNALWFLLALPCFASGKSLVNISSYEDNYALGTYTTDVNQEEYAGTDLEDLQNFEVKYQLSVAVPIYRFSKSTAIVGSYTQKSLWQLANSSISSRFVRPITNHNCLLLTKATYCFSITWKRVTNTNPMVVRGLITQLGPALLRCGATGRSCRVGCAFVVGCWRYVGESQHRRLLCSLRSLAEVL